MVFITVSFLLKRFHRKKRFTAHDMSMRQVPLVSIINSFSIAHFLLDANRLRFLGCRSRQAGSYAGLCGGVSASGQSHHLLPVTKHGNACSDRWEVCPG